MLNKSTIPDTAPNVESVVNNKAIEVVPPQTLETDTAVNPSSSVNDVSNRSLASIKQQALTKLKPIINNLDQPPSERFRTIMMIVQETNNANLLNQALEAANEITDNTEKAQALLDIANEVNYFTSK